ncbi:MAG TPA: hypothetical protein VFI56_20265 [Vicinamibacterales bacterium]|nr:hypothetical protein [Vicinamibacterales bacterium]
MPQQRNARMVKLDEWLFEKMDAVCSWQEVTSERTIECFLIKGLPCIVIRHHGRHEGFDIFMSASPSNSIDETFAAVERRIKER